MSCPNVINYIESVRNPDGLFRTLKNIEFVKDLNGEPYYITGSNSVIFKAHIDDKSYALKLFTNLTEEKTDRLNKITSFINSLHSGYFKRAEFFEDELYVYDISGRGKFFPVLIYEYAEGITLGRYVKEKSALEDTGSLQKIAEEFNKMALWILQNDFAHGDLKPENIIVAADGSLTLIDYDGMYIPELGGLKSLELGTRNFNHPLRDYDFFNRHTDDFSLCLLSIVLHLTVHEPQLCQNSFEEDVFVLIPQDVIQGDSAILNDFKYKCLDIGNTALFGLINVMRNCSPEINGSVIYFYELTTVPYSKNKMTDDSTGFSIFVKNGFYGYTNDRTGASIAPVYDHANPFYHGTASVRIMNDWFLINESGKVVCKIGWVQEIGGFSEGLALLKQKNKFGFIDKSGEIVVNLDYDNARNFHEELAGVKFQGKYGFINKSGQWIIPPDYDMVFDFHEGVAVYGINGKFGYLGIDGNKIFSPTFDFASSVKNGIATAENNGEIIKIIIHKK
ncbi:MAG: WG repeat-containing protein [Rikenellaceae bacterium]|nr:WG repeat-containing protein [Rikenellaceae bacterium]